MTIWDPFGHPGPEPTPNPKVAAWNPFGSNGGGAQPADMTDVAAEMTPFTAATGILNRPSNPIDLKNPMFDPGIFGTPAPANGPTATDANPLLDPGIFGKTTPMPASPAERFRTFLGGAFGFGPSTEPDANPIQDPGIFGTPNNPQQAAGRQGLASFLTLGGLGGLLKGAGAEARAAEGSLALPAAREQVAISAPREQLALPTPRPETAIPMDGAIAQPSARGSFWGAEAKTLPPLEGQFTELPPIEAPLIEAAPQTLTPGRKYTWADLEGRAGVTPGEPLFAPSEKPMGIEAKVRSGLDLTKLPDRAASDTVDAAAGRVPTGGDVSTSPSLFDQLAESLRAKGRPDLIVSEDLKPVATPPSAYVAANPTKLAIHNANEEVIAAMREARMAPAGQEDWTAVQAALKKVEDLGGDLNHTVDRIRAAKIKGGIDAQTATGVPPVRGGLRDRLAGFGKDQGGEGRLDLGLTGNRAAPKLAYTDERGVVHGWDTRDQGPSAQWDARYKTAVEQGGLSAEEATKFADSLGPRGPKPDSGVGRFFREDKGQARIDLGLTGPDKKPLTLEDMRPISGGADFTRADLEAIRNARRGARFGTPNDAVAASNARADAGFDKLLNETKPTATTTSAAPMPEANPGRFVATGGQRPPSAQTPAGLPPGGGRKLISWSTLSDALNIPRTLMTTGDISYSLRQGLVLGVGHPVKMVKAMGEQIRAFGSAKLADQYMQRIVNDPAYKTLRDLGLTITDTTGTLGPMEEGFLSKTLGNAPIVRNSNRAGVTFLNSLRFSVAKDALRAAEIAQPAAMTAKRTQQLKGLMEFVNAASGRSELPRFLEAHGDALNGVFFSPRFFLSRLNVAAALPKAVITRNPLLAKEAARDIAALAAGGFGVMQLAQLNGADVVTDPTSSDWGKIQVGNTRIDIWGGFQQPARLIFQMVEGKKTSIAGNETILADTNPLGDFFMGATGGEVKTSSGYGLHPNSRAYEAGRFVRGKYAPVPATAIDLLSGKNFIGQPAAPGSEAAKLVTPLALQDIYDAITDDLKQGGNGLQGLGLGALGLAGVGVQTIPDKFADTPTIPEALIGALGGQPFFRENAAPTSSPKPTKTPAPSKTPKATATPKRIAALPPGVDQLDDPNPFPEVPKAPTESAGFMPNERLDPSQVEDRRMEPPALPWVRPSQAATLRALRKARAG